MGRVIMRIFLLTLFATVAIGVPAFHHYNPTLAIEVPAFAEVETAEAVQPLAESDGTTFPIAGQDPDPPDFEEGIVLDAQGSCEVGELVRFDASQSNVEGLTWQILPHTPDFEVIEEGRRAFFSARVPGKFLVIIAGASAGKPYLQHHTIIVEGEPLPPSPKTLPQKVRGWVDEVEDYDGKADKAKAMAGAFRKLAANEDIEVEEILEATAVANSAILGDDLDQWIPFLDRLGQELDAYVEGDDLSTRKQYREVWLLIASGIEQAVPAEEKNNQN
jgi:hypothetical protein